MYDIFMQQPLFIQVAIMFTLIQGIHCSFMNTVKRVVCLFISGNLVQSQTGQFLDALWVSSIIILIVNFGGF